MRGPIEGLQREVVGFNDGDLAVLFAGNGGYLQPDPAGADHHDLGCVIQREAQRVGVFQRPQVVQRVEFRAEHLQARRVCAGRDQEFVSTQ